MLKKVPLMSLLVTLYILGSMNTVSGLRCRQCDGAKGKCKDQQDTGRVGICPEPGSCLYYKTDTGTSVRGCVPGEKDGCKLRQDPFVGAQTNMCFCNTDECNKDPPKGYSISKASSRLSQMSVWIFFGFPVVVTWISSLLY